MRLLRLQRQLYVCHVVVVYVIFGVGLTSPLLVVLLLLWLCLGWRATCCALPTATFNRAELDGRQVGHQ